MKNVIEYLIVFFAGIIILTVSAVFCALSGLIRLAPAFIFICAAIYVFFNCFS